MTRHLMEPDPDMPPVNPTPFLWAVVIVLVIVLLAVHS